jgi:hypothetical protein
MGTDSTRIDNNAVRLDAWLNSIIVRKAKAALCPARVEGLKDNPIGIRITPE